jgi:hypothetical protein
MSFPIKFKIVPKNGVQLKDGETPMLAPNGNIAILKRDFYTHVTFRSCADFELWVATEKVAGAWYYKQIGF